MHDVRMQLLDVFLWVCPGGEFREGGAIQGLVFFRSRDWRFPRCRWMCRASIVFLLEWLVSTCLTAAAFQFTLCCLVHACTQCRFSHRVFSLLLCVHLSSSPVFFLFLRCRHSRIRRMVPGTRHLSSSTLVGGLLFAPRPLSGFPSI